MSETLSMDDRKLLVGLCRAGRLYDVEKWIAAGKSIRVPLESRITPRSVAVGVCAKTMA